MHCLCMPYLMGRELFRDGVIQFRCRLDVFVKDVGNAGSGQRLAIAVREQRQMAFLWRKHMNLAQIVFQILGGGRKNGDDSHFPAFPVNSDIGRVLKPYIFNSKVTKFLNSAGSIIEDAQNRCVSPSPDGGCVGLPKNHGNCFLRQRLNRLSFHFLHRDCQNPLKVQKQGRFLSLQISRK